MQPLKNKVTFILGVYLFNHLNFACAEVGIPKDWPRMKEGFIEMQMMMNGTPQTMHLCMTKQDIANAETDAAKQNDCKIQKATRKGNVFLFEMECKDPENGKPMRMNAETVLISDSKTVTKIVATQEGQPKMQMETKMTRQRACTKEEESRSQRLQSGTPTSADMMEQYKDVLGGENAEKLKDLMKSMQQKN